MNFKLTALPCLLILFSATMVMGCATSAANPATPKTTVSAAQDTVTPVIDLNKLYAQPVGSVKVILGDPIGKHTYGKESSLGWGGEWTEYKVTGCSKVLVNVEVGKILMVAVSVPEVTADNIKDKWPLMLQKVGLSAGGVTPKWTGWDKYGTAGFDGATLQGVKLGDDGFEKKLPHVGTDWVNSVVFFKEDNLLVLWAGS